MKTITRLSGAAAMTALLCGCQSGGLPGWTFKSHRLAAVPHQIAADYAGILEEGKAQLRAGNLSSAAASFRMARTDPSIAAEANNGLAIVYAKLGRSDLADRYFRAALELEPESQRFAANLIRLQRQVLHAREASAARLAAIPKLAPGPRFNGQPTGGQFAANLGRIERVSRGSVRIRTPADLGGAPRIQVAYREKPAVIEPLTETPSGKVEDVRIVTAADKSRTYAVRFALER